MVVGVVGVAQTMNLEVEVEAVVQVVNRKLIELLVLHQARVDYQL